MKQGYRTGAGVLSGALIFAGLLGITVASWEWLEGQGWTPIAANRILWPSVMLLGPHRWSLTIVLLAAALTGGIFASHLAGVLGPGVARATAALAAGVALVAIPPVEQGVWVAPVVVHNIAYVSVLVSWVVSVVLSLMAARQLVAARAIERLGLGCLSLFAGGIVLGFWVPTGQLSRYLILFPMALWFVALAWLLRRLPQP